MTVNEYHAEVRAYLAANPSQRAGQAAANVLKSLRPELARRVINTAADPFYVDDNLDAFYDFIVENWDA